MKCYQCKSKIISRLIHKNGLVDVYCGCGHVWKSCSVADVNSPNTEINNFYGKWKENEINLVIKAIEKSRRCDDDFRIYKGKKIFALWVEDDTIEKIQFFDNITDLISNVELPKE